MQSQFDLLGAFVPTIGRLVSCVRYHVQEQGINRKIRCKGRAACRPTMGHAGFRYRRPDGRAMAHRSEQQIVQAPQSNSPSTEILAPRYKKTHERQIQFKKPLVNN